MHKALSSSSSQIQLIMDKKLELIFCPAPGIGHLISTVELAKKLITGHNNHFHATILNIQHHFPAWSNATTSYINSITTSGLDIQFQDLPQVAPPYKENMKGDTFICLFIEAHKTHVHEAVSSHLATTSVAALIFDVLCVSMLDVAEDLNVPGYIYIPSNATFLGLMLYLPTLDEKVSSEIEVVEDVIDIPVLRSAPPLSMPEFIMDKKDECYTIFHNYGYRLRAARGFIVNTFKNLEINPLKALETGQCLPGLPTPAVFAVGPLLATSEKDEEEKHECIKWLDEQPAKSVVFLCFGSMGCFDKIKVKEIALGLERSGQRFLWALRMPSRENAWIPSDDADLGEVLPEGFLERTREKGLVWPSWVPQLGVLGHSAVAGFVTHCGWNSVLESLWHGVAMVAWPLYAEQHMNAVMLVREMGVGLELKVDRKNGGFVRGEELEKGIRKLMEGEEGRKVRERAEEMKVAGRRAGEEGGSSYASLDLLVHHIINY